MAKNKTVNTPKRIVVVQNATTVDSGKMKVDIKVDELTEYSISESEEVMKISFSLSRIHNICSYHKLSRQEVFKNYAKI